MAVLSEDGKHYIVNGTKKWITNGTMADYATMAVRTGPEGSGAAGLSLLVVPLKDHPGVSRRRLKVTGGIAAGTSFIELDDAKVPRENLIGKEGLGMKYVMNNFNHERMFISVGVTRQARVTLSAAFAYCLKREAFGKVRSWFTRQPILGSSFPVATDMSSLAALDGPARCAPSSRQMRRSPRGAVGLGRAVRLSTDADDKGAERQGAGRTDRTLQSQCWHRVGRMCKMFRLGLYPNP